MKENSVINREKERPISRLRLTTRDVNLLNWINSIGFVTIEHIAQKLNVAHSTAYIRIKKLVNHHYLVHERIFHAVPGIYRVSHEGVQVSGSLLPPLRKISLASYHHDLLVISLSLNLLNRFGGSYVPERTIRHGDGTECFGKTGHTPDGVLVLDTKKIALEVELSKKSKRRLNEIFNHYLKNFDYKEVWYFCGHQEIATQLHPFLEKAAFVKVYLLQSFLNKENKHGFNE